MTRPPRERQAALLKFADAIEARADDFIRLEGENTGKPHALTRSEEIPPMLDQLRFFAGAARVLEGKSAGEYMKGHTSFVRREPIGVVGQVTPWNYPMMMAMWKIAPALAAGNTIVLKPSDTTPETTLLLAELASEFLPEGTFNVITGDRETGRMLVEHPTPALVAITGSVRAGMQVAESASRDVKRVHLELGGKAPVIVFDDADIEAAVEGIAGAGYFNAGQDCTAATRVLVRRPGPRRLRRRARRLRRQPVKVGMPDDDDASLGPVNNANQMAHVVGLHGPAARARARGRRRLTRQHARRRVLLRADRAGRAPPGRRAHPERDLRPGHHGAAVHRRGRGARLGQRGAVRPRLERLDQGLRQGDAHGQELDFGCVWINTHIPIVAEMPHGGFKHSGYGKDLSMYGLEDYTRIKHVMANIES